MTTKDGFYWVEPSKKHPGYHAELGGYPHVVFQGQNNNVVPLSASKMPKKYQKHRKQPQHVRRKRRTSTCGTKEPKQTTETRIEWQKQGKVIVQGGRKTRQRRGGRHNQNDHHHQQRKKRKKSRPKRSVSTPHHVEALVVADSSMAQFHDPDNVGTYLLTIMNMVSSLYKDPTIGNLVHIVVVKIIVLDEEEADEEELEVSHQAETTLTNFCR